MDVISYQQSHYTNPCFSRLDSATAVGLVWCNGSPGDVNRAAKCDQRQNDVWSSGVRVSRTKRLRSISTCCWDKSRYFTVGGRCGVGVKWRHDETIETDARSTQECQKQKCRNITLWVCVFPLKPGLNYILSTHTHLTN